MFSKTEQLNLQNDVRKKLEGQSEAKDLKGKAGVGGWAGEATNVYGFAAALLSAFTGQVVSSKRHNSEAILNNVEVYKTDLVLQVKSSTKFCRKQCNAPQETDVGRRTHKIIGHGYQVLENMPLS